MCLTGWQLDGWKQFTWMKIETVRLGPWETSQNKIHETPCLSQCCHLCSRISLKMSPRVAVATFPHSHQGSVFGLLGDVWHCQLNLSLCPRERKLLCRPSTPNSVIWGITMHVGVHFLPENVKLPGFELSAIFCKRLLLGKFPEKMWLRHALREGSSRVFGTSLVCESHNSSFFFFF